MSSTFFYFELLFYPITLVSGLAMMAKRSWPQSYSRLEWSRFLVCVLSALIVEACADPSLSKLPFG